MSVRTYFRSPRVQLFLAMAIANFLGVMLLVGIQNLSGVRFITGTLFSHMFGISTGFVLASIVTYVWPR